MNEHWYVAIARQGKEYLAKRELENQSFIVYLLLYIAEWAKKPRIKPLLPSYLFVKLAEENGRWRSMLSTYGVRTVLCSNDKPQAVAAWVIDEIQAREVGGLVQLPPRVRCSYQKGDNVRIKGSPLDAIFDE